jgi:hypothetical protein
MVVFLAAGGFWLACAQTIAVGTDTKTSRAVPAGFFGYNDERSQVVNPLDPNLLAVEAKVFSQVIRTNGDYGNYWDWKTGLYVTNYADEYSNSKSAYPRTLSTFYKQFQVMHSTPIYMLNMLTDPQCVPPAGGLCQFTPSTPNLNYQLQWLQAAQSMGLPLKYVELGNELYLTGKPGYQQVFPDPVNPGDPPASTVYAGVCTQWIAAIKKQFPQSQVAALAATSHDTDSRGKSWNSGLFPTLKGEDAITMHTYPGDTLAKGAPFDDASAEVMLAASFSNWAGLEKDIAGIPAGLPIWITEYDLRDESNPVWGTWAHGLFVSTMTLLYLEEPRVQIAAKYTLVQDAIHGDIFNNTSGFFNVNSQFTPPPNPPLTAAWGRSAADMALGEVGAAAASASQAVRLNFPAAPVLGDGKGTSYGAVYGWSFANGTAQRAVILNLSNQALTIDVSGLGLGGGAYDQISGAPFTYVTGGLSGSPTNLTETSGTLSGKTCALPAYSITRISTSAPPSHQPAKGRDKRRP